VAQKGNAQEPQAACDTSSDILTLSMVRRHDRQKQQVPPLRYAPVGMTILLQ
jgi:hypothetical protein